MVEVKTNNIDGHLENGYHTQVVHYWITGSAWIIVSKLLNMSSFSV